MNYEPLQKIKLACFIPLVFLSFFSDIPLVRAQVANSFINSISQIPKDLPQLQFPDNGAPKGRRRGGTSRNPECPSLQTPVTALVPEEITNNKSSLPATVSEYPTFWVYLPELPANINSGEFVLQDEEGHDIWRLPINLPGKIGAIAVNLPPTPKYALKVNNKYHWYFKVYCGQPQKKAGYIFVDAWFQRVALTPDLEQLLKREKSREYKAFAANNIWYDAVTNLAELRRKNSRDNLLTQDWANLMRSIGLGDIVDTPIVQMN